MSEQDNRVSRVQVMEASSAVMDAAIRLDRLATQAINNYDLGRAMEDQVANLSVQFKRIDDLLNVPALDAIEGRFDKIVALMVLSGAAVPEGVSDAVDAIREGMGQFTSADSVKGFDARLKRLANSQAIRRAVSIIDNNGLHSTKKVHEMGYPDFTALIEKLSAEIDKASQQGVERAAIESRFIEIAALAVGAAEQIRARINLDRYSYAETAKRPAGDFVDTVREGERYAYCTFCQCSGCPFYENRF